jgi:hypothetical protein
MSPEQLRTRLAAVGVDVAVEARDGFALLTAPDPSRFGDAELRARILAVAADHAFRSVALELPVGSRDGDG